MGHSNRPLLENWYPEKNTGNPSLLQPSYHLVADPFRRSVWVSLHRQLIHCLIVYGLSKCLTHLNWPIWIPWFKIRPGRTLTIPTLHSSELWNSDVCFFLGMSLSIYSASFVSCCHLFAISTSSWIRAHEPRFYRETNFCLKSYIFQLCLVPHDLVVSSSLDS